MKILLEDLIPGRYYKCYSNLITTKYYFRYKYYDITDIYSYGYEISVSEVYQTIFESNQFHFHDNKDNFSSIIWYNECNFSEEVSLKEIIDYFPTNHPERLAYYRKEKIKHLLSI